MIQMFSSVRSLAGAILAAFLATVAYLVVAFAVDDPAVQGLEKLWDSTEDREPTAEEARELERLGARSRMAARTEAGLMLVIVGAMAVAAAVDAAASIQVPAR